MKVATTLGFGQAAAEIKKPDGKKQRKKQQQQKKNGAKEI